MDAGLLVICALTFVIFAVAPLNHDGKGALVVGRATDYEPSGKALMPWRTTPAVSTPSPSQSPKPKKSLASP